MKKYFVPALAAATALAWNPASAADSRTIVPIYTVTGACAFASSVVAKNEITVPEGTNTVLTTLDYECNFRGLPTVTITSLYGGLMPQGDAVENGAVAKPIAYNIAFGDRTTSAQGAMLSSEFVNGVNSGTVVGGWTTATGAGQTVKPNLALYFPTLPKTKGTYLDALTIAIAP